MKEIKNELYYRLYHNWCRNIRNESSFDIRILIRDDFFINDLTEGIKVGLK